MGALFDLVNVAVTSGGSGPITVGGAVEGFRSFSAIPDGTRVSYGATDGTNRETGVGVKSGSTLTRETLGASSTGSFLDLTTNATISIVPNAGDFPIGKQTIFVPAAAMFPRVTNGPGNGAFETATNRINVSTLDFDATTQEFAQFQIAMPKSWDEGTISFDVMWCHGATSTNFGVVWSLAGVALSDTNALDTAFGSAVLVADTGGATNVVYDSPESAAVTIGNTPAENDYVVFQLARVPGDASDTMAVDARFLGIRLFYRINAGNDA